MDETQSASICTGDRATRSVIGLGSDFALFRNRERHFHPGFATSTNYKAKHRKVKKSHAWLAPSPDFLWRKRQTANGKQRNVRRKTNWALQFVSSPFSMHFWCCRARYFLHPNLLGRVTSRQITIRSFARAPLHRHAAWSDHWSPMRRLCHASWLARKKINANMLADWIVPVIRSENTTCVLTAFSLGIGLKAVALRDIICAQEFIDS